MKTVGQKLAETKAGMFVYAVGDATTPKADGPKIVVHVCNDIGAWGRGFVVALSRRWPEPEQRYRAWHRGDTGQLFALGQIQLVQVTPDIWVANLVGQRDIQAEAGVPPIRYDALREGLRTVALEAQRLKATVHMPRIGCGLAGGRWEEVSRIIQEELVLQGVSVTVYNLPG